MKKKHVIEKQVWFTADTHFGHENIMRYCNRPFATVREMDRVLVHNWNNCVGKNDAVFHLGDFCFQPSEIIPLLDELNGDIHLIRGNHDHAAWKMRHRFASNSELRTIKVLLKGKVQEIVLCHYAMRTWNKQHYGVWHVYGHSHGTLSDDAMSLSLDVGVDCHDYSPVSMERLHKLMSKKAFVPIDHHKPGGKSNKPRKPRWDDS